jgi:hypothetical protein
METLDWAHLMVTTAVIVTAVYVLGTEGTPLSAIVALWLLIVLFGSWGVIDGDDRT